ncbi:MAG: right-handed parallel beta-helix repeat-containing protein [Anaerolineales bacterium]|nr:right-handed parallel beta-helix repeat-containing protein [Anaerolineales bacterium]
MVRRPLRRLFIPLLLFLFTGLLPAGPARAALVQYSVNSAGNHDDGACSAGDCTLREAILAANTDGQDSLIRFQLSGPNPHVIPVVSPLPPLTEDGTILDGTTQPGYVSEPVVVLAGDSTVPVGLGLVIEAGRCVVRGLSLIAFVGDWNADAGAIFIRKGSGNLIERNHIGTAPVAVGGQNTIGVRIAADNQTVRGNVLSNNNVAIHILEGTSIQTLQANRIGTDPSGMTAIPNWYGIRVEENTSRVLIGGPGSGNLISGNTGGAISILGTGHAIMGNTIGMDAAGTAALPNHDGIEICGQAKGFRIGGPGEGEGNLISGNSDMGIFVGSGRHFIQGNKIGVDSTGSRAFGNLDGIDLSSCSVGGASYASHDVVVGGPRGSGAENVISGNISYGISILTDDHVVQGNYIGTDGSGSAAIPTVHGVGINITGKNNLIGGTAADLGNVISGNDRGIVILDDDNHVLGNLIGTDHAGSIPLGNYVGVEVFGDRNFIGGVAPGAGNLISGNDVGVSVEDGNLNQVLGNRIGTDAAGTAAVPNQVGIAVGLDYDLEPVWTIIGAAGSGNRIAENAQCGILVLEDVDSVDIIGNTIDNNGYAPGGLCAGQGIAVVGTYLNASRVKIRQNSIFNNGGLGIELIGSMANNSVDPPSFTSANSTAAHGTACPGCRVEVFAADPDPTGFGEGKTYIAAGIAGGNGVFSIALSGVNACGILTATATDPLENTSEFSDNIVSGCFWIPRDVFLMEIPLLAIIGGVCGFLLGRRRRGWRFPMAAAGGVLGGIVGLSVLFLPFVRVRLPLQPAEAEFAPLPICAQFLDESRTGPPDGAVFKTGTDARIAAYPADAETSTQYRWRLIVKGPDGASSEKDFTGGISVPLSEMGFDPATPGVYSWQVFGERMDSESGGWFPLCGERLGRSFTLRPDRILPDPWFPTGSETEPVVKNPDPASSAAPVARLQNSANCRSGPGTDYRVLTVLPQGGTYPIDGRDPAGFWWLVRLPDGLGHCWVAGGNVDVEGDAESVAEAEPPPLGCWVDSGRAAASDGEECIVPCPEGAKPGGVCEP